MLGLNQIKFLLNPTPPPLEFNVGDTVLTPRGVGEIKVIRVSPIYTEEKQGILRAYIIEKERGAWADDFLAQELAPVEVA